MPCQSQSKSYILLRDEFLREEHVRMKNDVDPDPEAR